MRVHGLWVMCDEVWVMGYGERTVEVLEPREDDVVALRRPEHLPHEIRHPLVQINPTWYKLACVYGTRRLSSPGRTRRVVALRRPEHLPHKVISHEA